MSEKETKKSAKANESSDAPIKCVSAFLSLENCEGFIAKANHELRIQKLRTEGLAYIRETDFLYDRMV